MRKFITLILVTLSVILFAGCNSDAPVLISGNYYAVGDYEEMLTPYLCIDTDKNEFQFGAGMVVSYAEYGTYKVADGVMIATSESTTYRFEIKDAETLVLIDNGDNEYFKTLINTNTQFVLNNNH